MDDTEGSTDGDKAESWGWFARHYSRNVCFSMMTNVTEEWKESMHTLIALSQAAFSWVLNDLHSLRTCGVTHSHEATADQRATRVTEKNSGTSIGGRLYA